MKHNLFTFLMACLASTCSLFASDTQVDGIWYNFDDSNLTASVTYRGGNGIAYNNEYTGNVSIPSSVIFNGKTYSVTSIGYDAFCNCSGLTSIKIPNSITLIEESAFNGCTGLTSVTIPNSVTSVGSGIFFGCTGLTSPIYNVHVFAFMPTSYSGAYTIPQDIESIGGAAFYGCSRLTSVTIPNSVTSIGGSAFSRCTGLTSITIPNSVSSIGGSAFSRCTGLTSITIPNSVIEIGSSAFSGCTGLTSITIPNSVISIDKETFKGCTGLTSITIGNSVTSIGDYAFEDCTSMTSIAIPNSVTSIGDYVFEDCTGLTSVTIPSSVISIGYRVFYGCTGLTSPIYNVHVFAFMPTSYSGAYAIPQGIESIGGAAFSGCTGLTSITIPNSVIEIGSSAFEGCTGLTSITIPNSVIEIGSSAFEGCTGLTSITIPNSISSIDEKTFCYCTGLTSVTIPNSVTSIGKRAFFGCTSLSTITLGNSVTAIGIEAFYGCTDLTSVMLPNSVTSVGRYAFEGCGLTSPIYNAHLFAFMPTSYSGAYTVPQGIDSIGDYAFFNCVHLTSIEIPNSVTKIGGAAFYYCTGLTSVTIPNTVTSIGWGAFSCCSSLTSVTIPNSVIVIEHQTFLGCSSLTSVTIPNSVTDIGTQVFYLCTNLTTIFMEGAIPPSLNSSFPSNVIVYVPLGSLVAYTNNQDWKKYELQVVNMEIIGEDGAPTSVSITIGKGETQKYIASCGLDGSEDEYPGNVIEWIGLEPESEYANVPLFIKTTAGDYDTIHYSFKTSSLELQTQQSKPVSNNAAILLAATNMADIETNCGFEWRRNDQPEDMASTKVYCPVANGTMAGRLKGLKDDVYYKYRAFYQSAAGNMYYGDWKYIFTGDDAVEFDPVLYTYAASAVKEHEATLKGYALEGSDDFTEQGFEYWADSRIKNKMPGIRYSAQLGDKKTVTATGISMKVTLTNLDQGTVYKYRTFAKMGDQIVYGSEMSFTTQGEWVAFTVTFLDKDGKVIEVQEVEAGTDAIAPQAPEVKGYKFIGWDKDITNVQSDLTVTAQYEKNEENPNEAIENVDANLVTPQKILHNGVLYILRDGKTYTVQGQEVK